MDRIGFPRVGGWMNAGIELICGCMFSGKTTELIRRVRTCEVDPTRGAAGFSPRGLDPGTGSVRANSPRILAFKPAIDDRYSPTDIVSHDGERLAAQAVSNASEVLDRVGSASVVAIDEMHFFDDSIVDVCRDLAARGVRVICCGLDRDMWGDEFPQLKKLSQIAATTVTNGVCRSCGRPADRTQRTTPLLNDNLVGGPEAFEPRCAACFTPPAAHKPAKPVPGLVD